MAVPIPTNAVAAFANFVRERLSDVGGTLAPLWPRRPGVELIGPDHPHEDVGPARHLAMVIIGAAAPFAPTAHARARLLRQAHASGLLSDREAGDFRSVERLAVRAMADGPADRFGASG
jgi:hypothetical protein